MPGFVAPRYAHAHAASDMHIYVKRPFEFIVILLLIVLIAWWASSRNSINIKRGKRDWE